MSTDLRSLYSDLAASGARYGGSPPEFPVKVNLDMGLPDPETFPVDDLLAFGERVLGPTPRPCSSTAKGSWR